MTRRQLLAAAGAAATLRAQTALQPKRNLGGAPAGFPAHSRAAREAKKPFDFVAYCHSLGFGSVETRINFSDPQAVRNLREKLESYQMRAVVDFPLPRQESDVANFETAVKAAKEAGVRSLHAAMTQRRYEEFDNFEAFKASFERCQKIVALAEPVLRKYRLPLGIENHKGWRAAEQAAWLKRVGSEWVGVHFDFGNNISLCEHPSETLRILRPYVIACHIKDMAVEPYEDGFLLAEVPLGEGFLDLKGMVRSLREKDPEIPFDLEMITRDPLKIPVLTDKYWVTFDDSYSPLPGRDLARTLEIVHKHKPATALPRVSGMSTEAFLKLEDENVAKSIEYARANLNL
jgi:sugar phosphate isomerase/epimerase